MYRVRVSLYLNLTQCSLFHLHFPITQTLKSSWRSCHILTQQFINVATPLSAKKKKNHSKDVYFFPQHGAATTGPWVSVHLFLWVLRAPHLFSGFSNRVHIQSSTTVIVFVNKVSCLSRSHLQKKNYTLTSRNSSITSAGMSHQAMSTTGGMS